ncbi:amidohydrolase family protein [Lichenifustis flavocetrariae]|uniref:Amidohydrolase family protein n=1 Tax=Lichenifustis flavocetrariae TaxID=2949735 RepID=A0AA41Z7N7_9HYPH|nr:amidohydrolase family protein [Lichenifustis flavocetrariae]MCW6511830.1 amidohydrolase family protein [Lichenifustis flavocetrariae]
MTREPSRILIRGGRVYDHNGDIHQPPVRDIFIEGNRISSVTTPDADLEMKSTLVASARRGEPDAPVVIEAHDHLVIPGLINAHYHSYDVLQKGMLEDMPFDVWALHSQPVYFGKRSKAELRARVLVGALEALRNGITTIQDMNTLVPRDEDTLDTILAAYAEVGIRVVFSIAMRDLAALDIAPFLPPDVPPEVLAIITGSPNDPATEIDFVDRQIARRPAGPRFSWAVSPSGPQRSSRALLDGVCDIAGRHGLPIFTHVYETKAQTAKAREIYGEDGGSMIRYLERVGLFKHRTTIAHGVWLMPDEMEILTGCGVSLAHNPISNLKLKSGIAPMRCVMDAGINVALGCDNCSCGDCQNLFQAMKMLCLLAGVTDPNPTGVHAADAIQAATIGGAKAAGLEHEIGRIAPGFRADLALLDLSDVAYLPFNSAARQLVYAECGRGVRTTIVDGRIIMRDGRILSVDEATLRADLDDLMPAFRRHYAAVESANRPAIPYLLAANRQLDQQDVGLNRLLRDR